MMAHQNDWLIDIFIDKKMVDLIQYVPYIETYWVNYKIYINYVQLSGEMCDSNVKMGRWFHGSIRLT